MSSILNVTSLSTREEFYKVEINALFNTARILSIYIQPILCIVGIVGNLLSLRIFLSKELRKVSSNIYLSAFSASCSVFLLAVFIIWLEFFKLSLIHIQVWCQCIIFFTYVSSFLTIWFIVCITVENYIVTFHLRKATYFCTVLKAKVVIFCLTMTSFMLYAFTFWFTSVQEINGQRICQPSMEYPEVTTIFTYVDTVVTLLLPTILLIVMISAILVKHIYQRHLNSKLSINGSTRQRLSKKEKSLLKITRVLLAIGLAYVLLSLPSYINKLRYLVSLTLYPQNITMDDHSQNQICIVIFYSNFTLNFLFYIKWSLNFRRGLKRLFRIQCRATDSQKLNNHALAHGQASVLTERTNAVRNTVTSV